MFRRHYFIVIAALVLGACGASPSAIDRVAAGAPAGSTTLSDVARICEESATSDQPGVVEVDSELRESNRKVTIRGIGCIVHLNGSASVTLNNVELHSEGTLNIHDRGEEGEPTRVKIQRSMLSASPGAGVLIELNDPEDSLVMENSRIDAPRGLVLRVAGTRGGDNSGGSIRLNNTDLRSDGTGTGGIRVMASEHSGHIRLLESTADSPATVLVLASDCEARRRGEVMDCSTEKVSDAIKGG